MSKIGYLSNMVNQPIKVFTTAASVSQITGASDSGNLPTTSFIVASEVNSYGVDTGVFNTFVTDAEGVAAKISYINKVSYAANSTKALYVDNSTDNVLSLEARAATNSNYGVVRIQNNGGLQHKGLGLGIKLQTNSGLNVNSNGLAIDNQYITTNTNEVINQRFPNKVVYNLNSNMNTSDDYITDNYIDAEYGSYISSSNSAKFPSYYWLRIGDEVGGTYYISYDIPDPYELYQTVYKNNNNIIVASLCYSPNTTIRNDQQQTINDDAAYAPIYKFKFYTNIDNRIVYTYFDSNGNISGDLTIFKDSPIINQLLLFDNTINYTIDNRDDSYTYLCSAAISDMFLVENNNEIQHLVNNSPQISLTTTYNHAQLNIDASKLSSATLNKKGVVSIDTGNGLAINNDGVLSAKTATSVNYGVIKYDNSTIRVNSNGQLYAYSLANQETIAKLDDETVNTLLTLYDKLSTYSYVTCRHTFSTIGDAYTGLINKRNYVDIDSVLKHFAIYNGEDTTYAKQRRLNIYIADNFAKIMSMSVTSPDNSINLSNSDGNRKFVNNSFFITTDNNNLLKYYEFGKDNSIYINETIQYLKVDDIGKIRITGTTYNLIPNIILYGVELYNNSSNTFYDQSFIRKLYNIYNYLNPGMNNPFSESLDNSYGYFDQTTGYLYLYIGDIRTNAVTGQNNKLACRYKLFTTEKTQYNTYRPIDGIERWDLANALNTDKCVIVSFDSVNHTEYIPSNLSTLKGSSENIILDFDIQHANANMIGYGMDGIWYLKYEFDVDHNIIDYITISNDDHNLSTHSSQGPGYQQGGIEDDTSNNTGG